MFWIPSVSSVQYDEKAVNDFAKRLEASISEKNREGLQDVVSTLIDWSYDADSNDLIQILRVIIIQNASSDEMCSQELLPLLFHCLDQDDSEISSLV